VYGGPGGVAMSLIFRAVYLWFWIVIDNLIAPLENPLHQTTFVMTPPTPPCKHPQVRIVSREEDAEFVECQVCGEVFDSAEFDDMVKEERLNVPESD
jgi:hypothetical protein